MSMFCKNCGYEETIFGFVGHLTGESLLILKQRLLTRSWHDGWDNFMAKTATTIKMPCSMCEKEVYWLAEYRQEKKEERDESLLEGPSE